MVPEALRSRQQWLVWKFETKPGQKKPAKMPYYVDGGRRVGTQGDDQDRRRLTAFEIAVNAKTRGGYDGVGFAFLKGDGLIGIDLDGVIDERTGEISKRAMKIVEACASFTEYSPSKRGLHIYVQGETATFKSNDIGLEVFCGSQFFTVTGEHFSGTPEAVNELGADVLKRLRATVDKAKGKREAKTAARPAPPVDKRAEVESALAVLSADCGYEDWLQTGMAIHAELGDGGLAVWDYWSSKGGKYPGAKALEQHWKSFRAGGGITGATLFKRARDAGWRGLAGVPRAARGSTPKKSAGGGASPPEPPPPDFDDSGREDPPPDGIEPIRWVEGQLPQIVDDAERALLRAGERIYQRDRMLVRVMRRAMPSVRNYKRPVGTLGIVPVDSLYLTELLTRCAAWVKWDTRLNGGKGDWRTINAPEKIANHYLSRAGHWKLPELWSVITAPTLRPDGTILQKPGYDPDLKAWFDPCGVEYPEIPDRPSKQEARAALEDLDEAFDELPFASKVDRSVALVLALTALVRRSLPSAPLGAITAPTPASGKTLLADCISILASGSAAPAMTYAETDEEARKTALAVLMEGDAVVLIDNIERPLSGDWLCSIITSEMFSQRVLGRTEMAKVLTTALILATGNQLVIAGDLRTRTLLCSIDPQSERPEDRQFRVDLREHWLSNRARLVCAGLTVLRAYAVCGEKMQVETWGRFERWSSLVREPLLWLDYADPCRSRDVIEKDDPEREAHLRLLHGWAKQFQDKPQTAREVIDHVQGAIPGALPSPVDDIVRDIAVDRGGTLNVKRLSSWLSRHVGRIAGGMRLMKKGQDNHVVLWKVETVNQNTS